MTSCYKIMPRFCVAKGVLMKLFKTNLIEFLSQYNSQQLNIGSSFPCLLSGYLSRSNDCFNFCFFQRCSQISNEQNFRPQVHYIRQMLKAEPFYLTAQDANPPQYCVASFVQCVSRYSDVFLVYLFLWSEYRNSQVGVLGSIILSSGIHT